MRKFYKQWKKINHPLSPPLTSTPLLSEKQIKKIYDNAKEDYLKTTMTINKTDSDAAVENADEKNEKIISDATDPTPGLFVDDQLNLKDHFKYKSNVVERSFNITKQLPQRLYNILETMIKKQSTSNGRFMPMTNSK